MRRQFLLKMDEIVLNIIENDRKLLRECFLDQNIWIVNFTSEQNIFRNARILESVSVRALWFNTLMYRCKIIIVKNFHVSWIYHVEIGGTKLWQHILEDRGMTPILHQNETFTLHSSYSPDFNEQWNFLMQDGRLIYLRPRNVFKPETPLISYLTWSKDDFHDNTDSQIERSGRIFELADLVSLIFEIEHSGHLMLQPLNGWDSRWNFLFLLMIWTPHQTMIFSQFLANMNFRVCHYV